MPPFMPDQKSSKWRNMAAALMVLSMKKKVTSDRVGWTYGATLTCAWMSRRDSRTSMFGV